MSSGGRDPPAPRSSRGSIAYIDCTIEAVYDGGDHDIVVGRVVELEVLDAKDPLLFWKGGYGTFA